MLREYATFLGAVDVGLGDDFQQRGAGSVEIDVGMVEPFVQVFTGVFFEVGANNADFFRVNSRAFFAAKRAREAIIPFSTILRAIAGFSNKKRSKPSENSEFVI